LPECLENLKGMFGFMNVPLVSTESLYYLKSYAFVLIIASIGATPLLKNLAARLADSRKAGALLNIAEPVIQVILLLLVTGCLVDGSFNPFLHFRF